MLEAYASSQAIPAVNGLVPFTSVSLIKGDTVTLSGTNSILLHRKGVYLVTAQVSGTPAAAGTVELSMLKDGVIQPQTTVTDPTAATTIGVVIPITTLVQVHDDDGACCCKAPVVVQFINTGVALNAATTSIVVTKVC